MGQMAATAGGVAVGHVVGSAITGALSGGGGQPAAQQPAAQQPYGTQPAQYQQNPCQYQIDELIRCTQGQQDITLCTGFSDALKECSRTYGLLP
ncbi:Coiled-coil-helix-coiled-coil-helix domain-containing protein 10 mitochondrial [Fasciola gigantica]|uniref:Coiled-coil-helix-coiled-coil-helix domain-containing protein 10 mitochondrial n=1 Tax=Fasciola gigantica TaxID=46835 RepID=A0A504Z443_FASGI|nr:Coiled-coil-helix-coiled-coil-helix domain-containing protein 10 mitochondrial [Fasciola gigantica]